MTEPTPDKSTAERVLDLALYAPLGLALSVAEALPELARKGRSRLGPQVGLARTVGELAVRQGYRQLVGIVTPTGGKPFGPFGAPRPRAPGPTAPGSPHSAPAKSRLIYGGPNVRAGGHPERDAGSGAGRHAAGSAGGRPVRSAGGSAEGDGAAAPEAVVRPLSPSHPGGARSRNGRAGPRPASSELAIPSYDSLSAPQVVQRLAGLSREEVAAVRAYEAATRGRRTILTRAEQLLG